MLLRASSAGMGSNTVKTLLRLKIPLDAVPAHLHLGIDHMSNAAGSFGFFLSLFGIWIVLRKRFYVSGPYESIFTDCTQKLFSNLIRPSLVFHGY